MPVEFLTDEEAAAYGRFAGVPSRVELERAFFLDDVDKPLIAKRRGNHNRLGSALQLTTVRWLGTFLHDPLDVPDEVVAYLADQLRIAGASCVGRYVERRTTRFEHVEEIRDDYPARSLATVTVWSVLISAVRDATEPDDAPRRASETPPLSGVALAMALRGLRSPDG